MSAAKVKKPAGKKAAAPRARRAAPARIDQSEFLARAWGMEVEAVERYSMLADAMAEHNNTEVADVGEAGVETMGKVGVMSS